MSNKSTKALFLISKRRLYTLLGSCLTLWVAAVCLAFSYDEILRPWVFPTCVCLLNIPMPLAVGLVFGIMCGAVEVEDENDHCPSVGATEKDHGTPT